MLAETSRLGAVARGPFSWLMDDPECLHIERA